MRTTTKDGIGGPEACSIVGITYRQLDFWARTDLVSPSIDRGLGSGNHRVYSPDDVVLLAVVRHLLDGGISLQTIRRAIGAVRGSLGIGSNDALWLVIDCDEATVTGSLGAAIGNAKSLFTAILDLRRVIDTTRALLADAA